MTRIAWFGPGLRPEEVASLADDLQHGRLPGGPDTPWAMAVRDDAGVVTASSSTMLISGVFWADTGHGPVIGTDPATVANALGSVRPDRDYLRGYATGTADPWRTPYEGVHRVPAGRTFRWRPGAASPEVWSWVDDIVSVAPDLAGDAAVTAFVAAFDTVVTDLAARLGGGVFAGLSSGLDSTFMVGSLQHNGVPVHAMTHRPLPAAGQRSHDEFPLAALLRPAMHEEVVNSAGQRPLDAARLASQRSGVPVHSPENQVWISDIEERLLARGVQAWWVGGHGNAAFSYGHPYAARYHVRNREWGALRRLTGEVGLRGVARDLTRRKVSREGYLHWLVRSNSALSAAANPAAGPLRVDPFCARGVLCAAARIQPWEWQRGRMPRAFARRAGAGRVPDEIRWGTVRCRQGADAWFTIRNDRSDYLQRAHQVSTAPGLEHVDTEVLMRSLRAWPWGERYGPAWPEIYRVNRLLALADFARGIRAGPSPGTLLLDPARVA